MTTISVQEAIYQGIKVITIPAKIILISATGLCVLLLIFAFSWLDLLLLPLGVLACVIYTILATSNWRIWAYEHVDDIHQLQRSAELAGLLAIQSYDSIGYWLGGSQKETLKELQKRFSEEAIFIDDRSIPNETVIYANMLFSKKNKPVMIINESGIEILSDRNFEWDQIADERIVQITFSRMSVSTGSDVSGGSKDLFRFEYPQRNVEIPLSSLDITVWKLDMLLYIYRGRFMPKQR